MSISEHPAFQLVNNSPEYTHWVAVSTDLKVHKVPMRTISSSISAILVVGVRCWGFKDAQDADAFGLWAIAEGHRVAAIKSPGPQLENVLMGL
jgi:hypothetical protein